MAQISSGALMIGSGGVSPTAAMFAGIFYLAVSVTTIVLVGRLAYLCGYNLAVVIIACLCMVIPLIALLLVLSINSKATTLLKLTGVRVGLLGVSAKEMEKLYEGSCINCGYCVRDLKSDRCPECGPLLGMTGLA